MNEKRKCGAQPKFTKEEDARLVELVKKLGENEWNEVAYLLKTKTVKQCRDRWKNYANPELSHAEWTKAEDELLFKKVEEKGTRWTMIKNFFPGRSINDVRYRWLKLNKLTPRSKKYKKIEQDIPVIMPKKRKCNMIEEEKIQSKDVSDEYSDAKVDFDEIFSKLEPEFNLFTDPFISFYDSIPNHLEKFTNLY